MKYQTMAFALPTTLTALYALFAGFILANAQYMTTPAVSYTVAAVALAISATCAGAGAYINADFYRRRGAEEASDADASTNAATEPAL